MIVIYDSKTGYGRRFAQQLGYATQSVTEPITEPYLLVTRNVGYGKIPPETQALLDQHAAQCIGVVVNGMKRFGPFYCGAARKIKKKYQLPIIAKIELSGSPQDVEQVRAYLKQVTDEQ